MDSTDIERATEGSTESHPELDMLSSPLKLDDRITAQGADEPCTTVISRQSTLKGGAFSKSTNGLLKRKHPYDTSTVENVVSETLHPRLVKLMHYVLLAGHRGQNKIYYRLRKNFYWRHMAASAMATVRGCRSCARNRVRLQKHLNCFKLFLALRHVQSVAVDIFGLLPRTQHGK